MNMPKQMKTNNSNKDTAVSKKIDKSSQESNWFLTQMPKIVVIVKIV
jgi:hypothetical protein